MVYPGCSFNVLDPKESLKDSRLLEASAGTGKTFAIEHCLIRLLFEGETPCQLQEILTVTFTRAATADLKKRIRHQLKNTAFYTKHYLETSIWNEGAPPYLRVLPDEALKSGLRRVEEALFDFDAASIFTIHQFCSRSLKAFPLESGAPVDLASDEEELSEEAISREVHDFFLQMENQNALTLLQWKIALDDFKGSLKELLKDVKNWSLKGVPLQRLPSFEESKKRLNGQLAIFIEQLGSDPEQFRKKYDEAVARFNGFKNINRTILEDFLSVYSQGVQTAADFDAVLLFCVEIVPLFREGNRSKAKKTPFDFSFADKLFATFALNNLDIGSKNAIKAHLADKLRLYLENSLQGQGQYSFQDYLSLMQKGLQNEQFSKALRQKYRVAIVDEFQDTDPLQWDIFQTLFHVETHRLFLVGDPKQAIYRFRQADIYTYLKAAKALGETRLSTLDTNYRSNQELINALNLFMSEENAPGWIVLPKANIHLPFRAVKAGRASLPSVIEDDRGALHFYSGDKNTLESFLTAEILRLKREHNVSFSSIAVLNATKHQERGVTMAFDALNIPYQRQEKVDIRHSPIWSSLQSAMDATIHCSDPKAIKMALSSQLFSWTADELKSLIEAGPDGAAWESVAKQFFRLKKLWEEKGFAAFFEALMQEDQRFFSLLKRPLGKIRAIELETIFEKILKVEFEQKASPIELLEWMKKALQLPEKNAAFLAPAASDDEAVQLMTIHKSKGLEFDYVFAVGLSWPKSQEEDLVTVESEGSTYLKPLSAKIEGLESAHHFENTQEGQAELLRQFYVAMTRAKERVYVPIAQPSTRSKAKSLSPLSHFFSHLNIADKSFQGILEHLRNLGGKASIQLTELKEPLNTFTWIPAETSSNLRVSIVPKISNQGCHLHSFTSLTAGKKSVRTLDAAPRDYSNICKTFYTLPAGSNTGIVLHKIFEKIDFRADDDELRDCIAKCVHSTALKEWQEVLFAMVKQTLDLPLPLIGAEACLKEIPIEGSYREMEFHYPCHDLDGLSQQKLSHGLEDGVGAIELKGVIDLIFYVNGRYYIVDWKSNWLGDRLEAYNEASLKKCMEENRYDLQAEIYKNALCKYLNLSFAGDVRESKYGGVIYLFLRGCARVDGVSYGVLWVE